MKNSILQLLVITTLFQAARLELLVQFHKLISEEVREFYFGTKYAHEVPEYDIVQPVHLSGQRSRRSLLSPHPVVEYQLSALGEEYHLQLECNHDLVSPGCLLTHFGGVGGDRDEGGGEGHQVGVCEPDSGCFYLGRSRLHNNSQAALNTCGGLHGIVSTPTHQILIQPIKDHHATDIMAASVLQTPHLVYKLPPRNPRSCSLQSTADQIAKSVKRVRRRAGRLYLEMLLVADKTMHSYHGDELVNYMLTATNVAAGRYIDSSLGVPIRLTVVRMQILMDDIPGLDIVPDADSTLSSFCKWQEKFNPLNDANPLHVDAASLMTRLDLVHKGIKETTGLASLGGICVPTMRCSVLEDNGLDIGLTLAHETGHSLNMNHDGEGNICDDKTNIMSTGGAGGTTAFKWSSCSKEALLAFLYDGKAACMQDHPTANIFHFPKDKPGVIYPGDKQCELFLGQGSRICDETSLVDDYGGDECGKLVCFDPNLPGQCTGSQAPRMDGTECGKRRWCINGHCTDIGGNGPAPQNGAWSSWGNHWSDCSRTCGGGVRVKARKCDNPRPLFGGNKCDGFSSKAELCNMQECDTSQYHYKEKQCAASDKYPLGDYHYHWLPGDTIGDSVCMLFCHPEGQETIHLRGVGASTMYEDGTECDTDHGTFHRCVAGKCAAFGCDGLSNSPASLDICGICRGKNDTCQKKKGSYFDGVTRQYVTFLTLPKGSTGIKITNDNQYTWMGIVVNNYRLFNNHDDRKDPKDIYKHDGVKVLYAPSGPESIQIPGPIPTKVHIQVYQMFSKEYSDANPEIYYEYYAPLSTAPPPQHEWVLRAGPCSVTCGKGTRLMEVVCERKDTGKTVENFRCDITKEPRSQTQTCIQDVCPARWQVGAYGGCSTTCGGGVKLRTVQCMRPVSGHSQVVSNDQCPSDSRDVQSATCGDESCPGEWKTGPWSVCSQTCGLGMKMRQVTCFLNAELKVIMEDHYCSLVHKPNVGDSCEERACFTKETVAIGNIDMTIGCVDNATTRCESYDKSVCSDYVHWAQINCPVYCNLCGEEAHTRETTDVGHNRVVAKGDRTRESEHQALQATGEVSGGSRETRDYKKSNAERIEGEHSEKKVNLGNGADVTTSADAGKRAVTGDDVQSNGGHQSMGQHTTMKNNTGNNTMGKQVKTLKNQSKDLKKTDDKADENTKSTTPSSTTSTTPVTSTTSSCQDVNSRCDMYPDTVCRDYQAWTRVNCRRKCGFCGQQGQLATTTVKSTPNRVPVTTPRTACNDVFKDCAKYHNSVCNDYKAWAAKNCKKYCNFCQ